MKFSIKDFFSKCDQIRRKPRIWSHLLKKSLMENFIFGVVLPYWNLRFAVQGECKISNFLHFRTQFHSSNTLALFINFIMVTSLLPKHHFKLKMCEHLGISALTGKGDDDSAIKKTSFIFKSFAWYWRILHSLPSTTNLKLPLRRVF